MTGPTYREFLLYFLEGLAADAARDLELGVRLGLEEVGALLERSGRGEGREGDEHDCPGEEHGGCSGYLKERIYRGKNWPAIRRERKEKQLCCLGPIKERRTATNDCNCWLTSWGNVLVVERSRTVLYKATSCQGGGSV